VKVVSSSGPSGHNVEYVLKLAHWLRYIICRVSGVNVGLNHVN
jgi:hypothetical protein